MSAFKWVGGFVVGVAPCVVWAEEPVPKPAAPEKTLFEKRVQVLFNKADKNKDGELSPEEMQACQPELDAAVRQMAKNGQIPKELQRPPRDKKDPNAAKEMPPLPAPGDLNAAGKPKMDPNQFVSHFREMARNVDQQMKQGGPGGNGPMGPNGAGQGGVAGQNGPPNGQNPQAGAPGQGGPGGQPGQGPTNGGQLGGTGPRPPMLGGPGGGPRPGGGGPGGPGGPGGGGPGGPGGGGPRR